jgi:CHAT domain-containing protein
LTARLLVSLLGIIPLAGTLVYVVPPPRTKFPGKVGASPVQEALLARVKLGPAEFRSGNFREAAAIAQQGYRDAISAHESQIAARFLNNLGASRFALHQYREALSTFLEARKLAETSGDEASAGKLDFNISTLYFHLNQMDAAVAAADRAASRLSGVDRAKQLPKLLIHMAALQADQGRLSQAVALYRRGIAAADLAGDLETYALGWNDLGYEYLEHRRLPQAEEALLEAYRLRKLNHLRSIESSYRNLGMLRLEQGDTQSAALLLDLAVECSRQPGGLRPNWEVYYARGRVHLKQNRLQDALDDLRIAARLARNWRREAPAVDATRVSMENFIQKVHSALVETGNRLYFKTHNSALAQETFESAEANRAASLRALLAEPRAWRRKLPPEYWETLQKLESIEVELLRAQGIGNGPAKRIQELEAALAQWESGAGSDTDVELPGLLAHTRRTLRPDTAFFEFHLATPDSYLWAVSRERFALYRLPAGPQIDALVRRFTKALRQGNSEAPLAGNQLFRMLFGALAPEFQKKSRWLLALDAQLFELPFAALTAEAGSSGTIFLAERHSLQIVSGAGMLAPSAPSGVALYAGPFVGVADPVYNEADPRWTGTPTSSFLGSFVARADDSVDLHLARVAGSAREVAGCAKAWGGSRAPIVLEGAAVTRQRLQATLGARPSVLHLATHVVHSSQHARSGLIVLSLAPGGRHDVLNPLELATWNLEGTLVALSGCGSGSADALPATGLMGLTRVCQAAGARAVVASLWSTSDDTGSIFLSFYRYLRAAPKAGPAIALQLAQIDMLRSHTWRSDPRYWSAYFATGNQQ